MMSFLLKVKGWWRLLHNNCPRCNGDAPLYFDCKICRGFHYKYRHDNPSKALKKFWWKKFLYFLRTGDQLNIIRNVDTQRDCKCGEGTPYAEEFWISPGNISTPCPGCGRVYECFHETYTGKMYVVEIDQIIVAEEVSAD